MQYKINDQHLQGQAVPPHQTNWIDYPTAEAALFAALRPELRLITLDHEHHFGEEVTLMVDEVAEAIYPKAAAILQQHGTRRAFSDRHLWQKCRGWARLVVRPHRRSAPQAAAYEVFPGVRGPGPDALASQTIQQSQNPRPARSAPPPRRPHAAPDRRPAWHRQKHCWRGAAARRRDALRRRFGTCPVW